MSAFLPLLSEDQQQMLRGDLSIPAQCLKDDSGKVVGSSQKLESIPADEFIAMFRETLDTKYGTEGPDREEAERVLRERQRRCIYALSFLRYAMSLCAETP